MQIKAQLKQKEKTKKKKIRGGLGPSVDRHLDSWTRFPKSPSIFAATYFLLSLTINPTFFTQKT